MRQPLCGRLLDCLWAYLPLHVTLFPRDFCFTRNQITEVVGIFADSRERERFGGERMDEKNYIGKFRCTARWMNEYLEGKCGTREKLKLYLKMVLFREMTNVNFGK